MVSEKGCKSHGGMYRPDCVLCKDATIASLTRELEEARGMCDLYVDEFHRIIAIADNSEIKGLCERAVFGIKQRIPLIEQRDNLEAENAALRAELADLKDGLTAAHMDGFASGKAEATEMLRKREGQLEELRAEVEQLKKELRILYSSNADMFARAEAAEKELAAERGKSKCNHEWKEWTSTAGRTRQCIKCGQQYSWFG